MVSNVPGVYDSGGVLRGEGGIKATARDEVVFGPELSEKLLRPETPQRFRAAAEALDGWLSVGGGVDFSARDEPAEPV